MYNLFLKSNLGLLEIICNDKEVLEVTIRNQKTNENPNNICYKTKNQLEEYLNNKRKTFNLDFKLNGTNFQNKVWQELIKIPFGKVISYQELANRIGNSKGVRAVANAVGSNKHLIIIPCHRIVGTNKTLTGFGGGLENKIKLLTLENHRIEIKKELKKSIINY